MTKEEKNNLLRLYELLWEEIKNDEPYYLQLKIIEMRDIGKITQQEKEFIGRHIIMNFTHKDSLDRKSFVLEQIDKLKKEE